jgi:hypothetical protein
MEECVRQTALAGILVGVVLLHVPALADEASETALALTHAYRAAQSTEMSDLRSNLHHVINCLVGPGDKLFDAAELNPCSKSGKGILNGTTDAITKKHLQDALDMAELGIASTDLTQATMMAVGAAGALRASQSPRAQDTGLP